MDRNRRVGKKDCGAGWIGFVNATKILEWQEKDPMIHLYKDTAIVTYYYDMLYEMDGQNVRTGGRDMFTFVREGNKWLAVANQFSSFLS